MSPFALEEPASLSEALALLDPDDPAVRAIAGGTALMLMMKSGLYRPQRLVSLRRLGPALTGIQAAADGGIESARWCGLPTSSARRRFAWPRRSSPRRC